MATAYSDNEEDGDEDNTEEVFIKYYFYRGYQYKDILDFLATYYNIEISKRTLHRRLRMYGLSRGNPEYDIVAITDEVRSMLDGPACVSGYRHMWHSLQLKGYQVPRQVVELLLRELDPDGCQQTDTTNLNPMVFQCTVVLTAGAESCYGWWLPNQTTHLTTLDLTFWMQLKHAVGVHFN